MEIEEYAKVLGADVFGIADLEVLKDYPTYPPKLLNKYTRGISIGVKTSDDVFDGLPETRSIYAKQSGRKRFARQNCSKAFEVY